MNSTASRLRAIAVTALFFAASAFTLLTAIWVLDMAPFTLPGYNGLAAYAPGATLANLLNAPIFTALGAAYLVSGALVILIDTQYCDRMFAIFADVLLMAIAAAAGFAAGYWVLLRLADASAGFDLYAMRQIGICALVVFALSVLPLHRVRGNLAIRVIAALILLLAGPLLLLTQS